MWYDALPWRVYFCRPFNKGMSTAKLKVGVLGAGHLGRIHLQQWREVAEAEVIGFFDPHPEKCEAITKEFGFRPLPDMHKLIDASDAVDIVTPTTQHHSCATAALSAGKHIFIEKPIAQTLAQADELVDMVAHQGLCGQVGHVERFNPAFVAAQPHLQDPMFIEVHRLAQFDPRGTDVSVVLDLMIHDIDLVLAVVNSPVVSVSASGVAVVSDSPDITNARIAFANGCVANLTASRISLKKMRKARFFQRDAYVSVDLLEKKTEVVRMQAAAGEVDPFAISVDLGAKGKRIISFDRPEVPAQNAIREELRSFAQAALGNGRPAVSLRDGTAALRVAHHVLADVEKTLGAIRQ